MLTKNFKNEETKAFAYNLRYYNGYEKNVADSIEVYRNVHKIQNLKSFECPDMYIELEDKVIGIEQFEFSAYSSNKKGDSIKRKVFEIEQENIKKIDDNKANNYFENYIETDISRSNYEKNFIKNFDKHYCRIQEYKSNLSRINNNVEIYFLICDETVDGTGIYVDNNYEFYVPIMNKNILEYLLQHQEVNGIIFQCSCVYNKKLFYYLKNTKQNIDKLLKENTKYFNLELEKENFTNINSYWRFSEDDQ
jgi:hypothetical protein